MASEYHGQVTFGGLPVPGAIITASHGSKEFTAITDQQGVYTFADLADGTWTIEVKMLCFLPIKQEVTIAPNVPAAKWDLKLLPLNEIEAHAKTIKTEAQPVHSAVVSPPKSEAPGTAGNAPEMPKPQDDTAERANDGFLINGSENNAATSQFTLAPAFGNRRNGAKSLYTGGLAMILDNSALDARTYSLSGLDTPKTAYNRVTGVFTFGGPLNIPHLFYHGPSFFIVYQWTRDHDATTESGLVPDQAERNGDFSGVLDPSGQPVQIFNPATGKPFTGNVPISPQALALLNFYPLPNVAGNSRYNYQIPVVGSTHQDALQTRLDKTIGHKNQIFGRFAFQDTRNSGANLFGFVDKTNILGINTNINWSHRFSQGLFLNLGFQFSRLRTQVVPYFASRENVSGQAGISGNNQEPANWGPPGLAFSSGIGGLADAQSSFNRNRSDGVSSSILWNHGHHNVTLGGDFRRQEFNYLSQQNPRGAFTFTGAATRGNANGSTAGGSDFADFLLGVPDTSAIAFGNADKYFRQSVYDAYITDDWRLRPELTINAGIRWEYGAPITELFGRLVNLDVAPGFSAVAPVLGSNPTGTLTGERYPGSLIRPDRRGIEPRVAISWRPIAGSSMVVRAGYGVYDDTSVYQATALEMAQQSPLSKSLSVQNSPACPLTLAKGFNSCSSITPNTFAVDPNFRVGYAQTWQLTVQRDLPGSLVLTANYLGIKGTRGVQEYLPNTYPIGATNPCPACPIGFVYRTSNGNSTREAGQVQLRRRLRSGFTASLQYTYSKSLDDDSVLGGQGPVSSSGASQSSGGAGQNSGGPGQSASQGSSPAASVIAQNWLDLSAERGRSTFDQRHLLAAHIQYTTGMGIGGGTLLGGWRGTLLKEWTILGQIGVGSGLPQSPSYFAAVPGTGVIPNGIRPNVTGAPLYKAPSGFFLNPAAYTAPLPGQWGTAARNSITGPGQFSLNASMARTFRLKDHFNLDLRIDSTNLLNHAVFSAWNTTINNAQFGLPVAAHPMRSVETTMRLRF